MIATSVLTVDLGAVADRYRSFSQAAGPDGASGAAVKANAYGLGVSRVAPVLYANGCRDFFVATVDEGADLVRLFDELPLTDEKPNLFVLSGAMVGQIQAIVELGLIPVINSVDQAQRWASHLESAGIRHGAALHFDTGMRRLGVPADEADHAAEILAAHDVVLTMSHLACADEPDHGLNTQQLERFRSLVDAHGRGRASLANSAGIGLGPDYHFDLVRPGIGLYEQAVTLHAPIIQVQRVLPGESVGYGAAHEVVAASTVATISTGYADGFHRSASSRGVCHIEGVACPILGRVSMDLISIDVSEVPEQLRQPGQAVELIGPSRPSDVVGEDWGTISYEVLTSLGRRGQVNYVEASELPGA